MQELTASKDWLGCNGRNSSGRQLRSLHQCHALLFTKLPSYFHAASWLPMHALFNQHHRVTHSRVCALGSVRMNDNSNVPPTLESVQSMLRAAARVRSVIATVVAVVDVNSYASSSTSSFARAGKLRSRSNFLCGVLAIADLLSCAALLPVRGVHYSTRKYQRRTTVGAASGSGHCQL